jgi:hypothetical protein
MTRTRSSPSRTARSRDGSTAETINFHTPPLHWKRSTGHFVESHCGLWHITPIYGGLTRPESYELWFGLLDRYRVGSGQTQRECKAHARAHAKLDYVQRQNTRLSRTT